jgi:hypothetical protein
VPGLDQQGVGAHSELRGRGRCGEEEVKESEARRRWAREKKGVSAAGGVRRRARGPWSRQLWSGGEGRRRRRERLEQDHGVAEVAGGEQTRRSSG